MDATEIDAELRIKRAIEDNPADRVLHAMLADCLEDQGLNRFAEAARWVSTCQPLSARVDGEWSYFWLKRSLANGNTLWLIRFQVQQVHWRKVPGVPPPIIVAEMVDRDWFFFKNLDECIAVVGKALLKAIDKSRNK